jgi:16S rRNA (uracil1498-N3)-methyltransferase
VGGGRGAVVITVLVPAGILAGERHELDEDEAHHLKVRRARAGEPVGLRDGAGLLGSGRLALMGKRWVVDVEAVERVPRPPQLTLVVGAGDRDRFGWLVEKAGELGVTRVVPLETERSGAVATRVREGHLARLRRQGREALKQCGAAWEPEIAPLIRPGDLPALAGASRLWLADAAGDPPPACLDREPVTAVIGPEGGLTPAERDIVLAAGARTCALGPYTLRFETAAGAAAAAVAAARLRGIHG